MRFRGTEVAVIVLCWGVVSAQAAPFLRVDFNQGAQNQAGFEAFTRDPSGVSDFDEVYTTSEGSVTVTGAGFTGNFFRNPPISNGGALTYADLYNDFMYVNGGTFSLKLSGPGIDPNAQYNLRLFSYDSGLGTGVSRTTTFTPQNGTAGAAGTVTYISDVPPTTNELYSTLVTWTSNNAGEIDFLLGANGEVRINGFELSVVPEPASAGLLALGALALTRRTRTRRVLAQLQG